MKLHDYQQNLITALYEHDRAIVQAKVGAGKTGIALTAMQEMLDSKIVNRWLVVGTKRIATDPWLNEPKIWTPELRMTYAIGTPKERLAAFKAKSEVVVTTFDNIQTLPELSSFDGVVIDELTHFANPSGKRFKYFYKAIEHINIRWGFTGSFTSRGLENVFGQCKMIEVKLLGRSKGAFLQQYFICTNPEYNLWEPLPGSMKKVMEQIKANTFVLEPAVYSAPVPAITNVYCELPDRDTYEAMKKKFVVEYPDWKAIAINAAVVTQKLQQIASGFIYRTEKKPDPVKPGKFITNRHPLWLYNHKLNELDNLLEENGYENTIIVYNFDEELEALKRHYPDAETLDNSGAIARWSTGKINKLLIHPKSAGHGLNLQHGGRMIVFYSLPWSYELFEQVIGRICRQGQTQEVLVYLLLAKNTVEERMLDNLKDLKSMAEIAYEALL